MRDINVVKVISRLVETKPEFVSCLYDSLYSYDKSTLDGADAFWKDKYIRKWMSIEDAFHEHGINIVVDSGPCSGLAFNLAKIREYLDTVLN